MPSSSEQQKHSSPNKISPVKAGTQSLALQRQRKKEEKLKDPVLDALTDSLDQLVSDKEAIKLDKFKKIKPLPKVPSDQILFHGP